MSIADVRHPKRIEQYSNGSIVDEDGNFVFVSQADFLDKVVNSDRCFICVQSIIEHTDEHVIPDWIIRRCNLADKSVTLPNGSQFRYSAYKVPCCKECNSFLGRYYEEPVSDAFAHGHQAVFEFANTKPDVLFGWLNLIVFKTHLKDLSLRSIRDLRVESGKIGDIYDWINFHHMHALIRAPKYNTIINRDVIGSISLLTISDPHFADDFDYRDHVISDTVYIRIGDMGIIAVLNDSCAVSDMVEGRIKLERPPNLIQCAEILTEYQAASLHLKNRPTYRTELRPELGLFEISATFPESKEIAEYNAPLRGEIMWFNLQPFLKAKNQYGQTIEELKDEVLSGNFTFMPI
jgi:hypothetical protein